MKMGGKSFVFAIICITIIIAIILKETDYKFLFILAILLPTILFVLYFFKKTRDESRCSLKFILKSKFVLLLLLLPLIITYYIWRNIGGGDIMVIGVLLITGSIFFYIAYKYGAF